MSCTAHRVGNSASSSNLQAFNGCCSLIDKTYNFYKLDYGKVFFKQSNSIE